QVYVDDIIFGSTKKSLFIEFEGLMHKKFQMSSMGKPNFFLGLQVMQRDNGIFISQDKYVADILKKFDFSLVKTASTPIETNKALLKDKEAEYMDVHLYRSMIGSLMYLTISMPDIMFAVCACARFQGKKQIVVANSTTEAEDSYEKRLIQVIKIHTDHNVDDLLTKAFDVSSDEFEVKTGSCKVNAARDNNAEAVLKTGKYDLWSMRMEQYLTFTDHALWEVIVNGDSVASASAEGHVPPKTAKQKLARKNKLKAKITLMLPIPNEHLLKFHACKDAKSLWEAIKNRFGGNKESKKMQKTILKQNYENFAASCQEGLDKTYDRFQKLIKESDKNDQEKDVRGQEETLRKQFERLFGQREAANTNSTNRPNTVSSPVNVVSSSFTTVDPGIERAQRNEFESMSGQDKDANVVSPIPTTKIYKDHPKEQIIRDPLSAPQTKRMTKTSQEHAMVIQALTDPSWIEAMQDELL
nr:ribonuclease H-like domain, reverse transcriptase, RNA-dependent DNA polymerase [Tanacetum cinerariifolium]